MAGVTYCLAAWPEKLDKLQKEIRSAFTSEDEIDNRGLQKLPYLFACVDEGSRIFAPTPEELPRVVRKGGDTICGTFIPEGVS